MSSEEKNNIELTNEDKQEKEDSVDLDDVRSNLSKLEPDLDIEGLP